MSADPHEVFEDLDEEDECIYLDRPNDPAYIWRGESEGQYVLLEQSSSGSWLPRGRPIDESVAESYLGDAQESDVATFDVRPQTELPPGRHRKDR